MAGYIFPKKTIRDISVHDKRILMRADFNVSIKDGVIQSDYRITQTIPTIEYLLERGCEIVILSHLGRPKGERVPELSLEPVARHLSDLLNIDVRFIPGCIGDGVHQGLKKQVSGRVTLLENVRFHSKEEENDPDFAEQIIADTQPDYVVQDGFGVVHRAHASTEGVSHLKPAVAGLLLEREVTTLASAMESPEHPFVAVLGGAKISDKLPLVERFLDSADTLLIGGAMANNFIAEAGHEVGESLVDAEGMSDVKRIVSTAGDDQLVIPTDVVVAQAAEAGTDTRICGLDDVGSHDKILDIGSETVETFEAKLDGAQTVVWNGTLGLSEFKEFAHASAATAAKMSSLRDATTIIGGGDTADFVLRWQQDSSDAHFTHISTGGGASLELMSGKKLPGVEALLDK